MRPYQQQEQKEKRQMNNEDAVHQLPTTMEMIPKPNSSSIAKSTGNVKIFALNVEFALGQPKSHSSRLMAAYMKAVKAATTAVASELLEGSIEGVTSYMIYGYRHLEGDPLEWEIVNGEDNGEEEAD
jgi:hypothetical protein